MGLRRHTIWPCLVGIAGYHITARPGSTASWDLRVDALNGDAITVEGVSLSEAQAFISCLQKMLLHLAPEDQADGPPLPDIDPPVLQDVAARVTLQDNQPPGDTPPDDAAGSPLPDPPSTGPEPGAAPQPFATGGWVTPGTQQVIIGGAGGCDYALPADWNDLVLRSTGGGPGPHLQFTTRQLTLRPAAATHVWPRVVHVGPGEVINLTCSCTGGTLSDDPNCPMHHSTPTTFVFDER